jgi:beta-galactosidase
VDMKKFLIVVLLAAPVVMRAQSHRENFDAGWRFFLGDDSLASRPDYDDSRWRVLDLPHDWSIEGRFDPANSTGQQEGGLPAGVGWYRKKFRGNYGWILFDGVYRNSAVWINGHYLGKRPYGYISFRYEIGKWMTGGENVVAVRVDNSKQPNSRWYSGSGIYRHVWVERDGGVDPWTMVVTTEVLSSAEAVVRVSGVGDRKLELYDAAGKKVTEGVGEVRVSAPNLWSPEHPYLYRLRVDGEETAVGIRSFRFDVMKGFFLNGRHTKILGVCMHHDLGLLGAAVNESAMRRQLKMLKEMGCNAIRTAHNPPAPEWLDLCDEMGFLVMDEAFDMWRKKKNKYDYSLDFPEWGVRDIQDQVRRDRNHPSVILWSIGNEIREQFDSSGITFARRLAAAVRDLDTTRPVTSALTETDTAKNFIYRSGALDLIGLNYNQDKYDSVPVKYPGKAFIASETGSTLATRGHYDGPADSLRKWPSGAKQPLVGANADYTVSAYDNVFAYWGSTHEQTWKVVKRCPWVSGLFVWSGWDFIGEPVPYPWPARSSYYGIIDLAGFPKDAYYMYQSEWTERPVLHLLPHWNWGPGQVVDVWAYYSQADEVELFLNGRSLGVRRKEGDALHVSWRVAWEPGVLRAVSRRGGKTILQREVRTAGKASRVELSVEKKVIGKELAFITARVADAAGTVVPDAGNELVVSVDGPGGVVGMDNGYQADLESFRGDMSRDGAAGGAGRHRAYNGLCLIVVKGKKAGKILVHVAGKGLKPATIELVISG